MTSPTPQSITSSHETQPQQECLPRPFPSSLNITFLDTIPQVLRLLSRLKDPHASQTSTAGSPPASTPLQTLTPSLKLDDGHLISLKELPPYGDLIKSNLQKVKMQIKELPDLGRTVEEQEDEIRIWEGRIAQRTMVLEGLRKWGLQARDGQTTREGDSEDAMMVGTED